LGRTLVPVRIRYLNKSSIRRTDDLLHSWRYGPEILINLRTLTVADGRHFEIQKQVPSLVTIEPDTGNLAKLEYHTLLVKEIPAYHREQVLTHPVEATPDLSCPRPPLSLQFPQLIVGE
jgi:hypothetical protein